MWSEPEEMGDNPFGIPIVDETEHPSISGQKRDLIPMGTPSMEKLGSREWERGVAG